MLGVQFDDDLVGQAHVGIRRTDGGGKNHTAARRQVAGFNNRPVDLAEVTVTSHLRHSRQVLVEKAHGARVDLLAQGGVALIRRTEADRLRLGQCSIQRLARRSTGQNANLERTSRRVLAPRLLREGKWNRLGSTRSRKAAETDILAVLDEFRRFFSGENRER